MAIVVNYYQELGLRPEATLSEIREELRDLKLRSASKAGRTGSEQQMWMRLFELSGNAEIDFADEDSRESYDLSLRRERVVETAEIDWTARAWSYYYLHDYGAAAIAARKAKEHSPNSPMSYVVSAWIHLGAADPTGRSSQLDRGELEQARLDADEAFVLDESSADVVDVQGVRGAVYHWLGNYDRAVVCLDRALDEAASGEKPELYWRKALTLVATGQHEAAVEAAVLGLSQGLELQESMSGSLEELLVQSIASAEGNTDDSDAVRRLETRIDLIGRSEMGTESKHRVVASVEGLLANSLCRWAYRVWELRGKDPQRVIDSLRAPASEAATASLPSDRRAAVLGYIEKLVQHQERRTSLLQSISGIGPDPKEPSRGDHEAAPFVLFLILVLFGIALFPIVVFFPDPGAWVAALFPGAPALALLVYWSRVKTKESDHQKWLQDVELRHKKLSSLQHELHSLESSVPKPLSHVV